jgi:hypothetical protein
MTALHAAYIAAHTARMNAAAQLANTLATGLPVASEDVAQYKRLYASEDAAWGAWYAERSKEEKPLDQK